VGLIITDRDLIITDRDTIDLNEFFILIFLEILNDKQLKL